ncbi:hypothetical protein [Sorangium sp. So ce1182]|uniref:hypothetical protein n=1 Tax=Sorangium sp. So ce1182 TaxID=3133334 RepID=UPI003F63F1AE
MADAGASLSELAAARQRIEALERALAESQAALAASEAALTEVRSSYRSLYETIRVMSTPLLPLADGVLAVPLRDRCGHEREVAAGAPDFQVR